MTEERDPVEDVRRGYDAAAESYSAERDQFESQKHLERFRALIPPPGEVLDVGCGSGIPVDRYLVEEGYSVTGIDLSPKQIELAKGSVPGAHFEVMNMLDLRSGQYDVDGILSFYAIFHTPRERHEELLNTLASFLRPGGVMLITMGASDYEGTEEDFHGVEMYWSHYDPPRNRELVEKAGLTVVSDEIDEGGSEHHQVIIARRR